MVEPDRRIYGLTGEVGRDGILTIDQQALLNLKQHEAARAVLSRLEQRETDGPYPIAVMATGIGKTRVEHELIETWKSKNPKAKILFIAGTKLTLVEQSSRALSNYQLQNTNSNGNTFTESEDLEEDNTETEDVEETLETEEKDLPFYRVGRFKDPDVDVQVATIQTIQSAYKRGDLNFDDYDLVIVDEVHNIGTPTRSTIIRQFKNVAGFTATSNRNSGPLKRPEQYGFEVAYNLPLPEAQELRLLPPLLGMQVDTTGLVDEIPTTRNGRIDYKKLEEILKKSPDLYPFIADRVSQIIKDGEKEYKTVIACNFVSEAYSLAQLLKDKGVTVGIAINEASSKRLHSEEIPAIGSIDRYKLPREDPNSIQVLISPYVASEGFDAPFTEVLVWASPTGSDLRYTQYVGRLARRSEGKLFGVNVDFLYQTSQFGWSYNMGMWMKGNVRQLPNGLLYLGPEQDIAGLSELDVVRNMRRNTYNVNISDLQKDSLEEIKETDLPLTKSQIGLLSFFTGRIDKISLAAEQVKAELEVKHPEYFTNRKTGSQDQFVIGVVTSEGTEPFIRAMAERGIKLKNKGLQEVQDNDLPLTPLGLSVKFQGGHRKLIPLSKQIKAELEIEHPEYFAYRRRNRGDSWIAILVVTGDGENDFTQMMLSKGIKLRLEDQEVQDAPKITNDGFILDVKNLMATFKGSWYKLYSLAQKIKAELEIEHPEYFAKEKIGPPKNPRLADTVTTIGLEIFIRAMVNAGAQLKKK